jgi:hypothetical protein
VKPGPQVTWHAPATHATAPLAGAGPHPRPHAPQWAALVASIASQPLPASPSQSPNPGAQSYPQAPVPEHRGAVAFAGVGQATVVDPVPSAPHTLRAVDDAQVALPGVHAHEEHPIPTQLAIAGHATAVLPRPSALQTLDVRTSAHVELPGTHACAMQTPPLHERPGGHATDV